MAPRYRDPTEALARIGELETNSKTKGAVSIVVGGDVTAGSVVGAALVVVSTPSQQAAATSAGATAITRV